MSSSLPSCSTSSADADASVAARPETPPSAPRVSKKQLRKQAKAQFLAERKAAARRAASGDDAADGGPRRQRKRRNQRKCNSGEDAYTQSENPDVQYVRCTAVNCKDVSENAECQMRTVAPYVHRFQSFVKARWCGRSLGDVFLEEFEGLSPQYCQAAIAMGLIRINGEAKQSEYILRNGDFLEHAMHRHEPAIHLDALEVRSLVHWNSDDVVVVNKPSSVPVHPSGAYRHNSITFLLQRECELPELFPVHRLDRLTSGLLMFSKSAVKARALCDEIASGGVQKHYVARILGEFPIVLYGSGNDHAQDKAFKQVANDALVEMSVTEQNSEAYWRMAAPIACISPLDHVQGVSADEGSKSAETLFRRLSYDGCHSVVECLPITGRTHQIRVHLKHLGFPIVNDPLYGPESAATVTFGEENGQTTVSTAVSGKGEVVTMPQPHANAFEEQEALIGNEETLAGMEEVQRCESICPACRDGDATVLSSTHLTCFSIWLHSYKYHSSSWCFEVPFPAWAKLEEKH